MSVNFEEIMKANQVTFMKLSQIIPDPGNSRVHDVHNIDVIKRSLLRFGQYRPFVIQKSNNYIRVGNGMYQAMIQIAKQNGQNTDDIQVKCVVIDITDEQANVLSVVDNKSTDLSYNDNAKLGQIFKDMSQQNLELTGFSTQQVSKILQNFNVNIDQVVNPVENVKTQQQKKEEKAKTGVLMYKLLFENEQQKAVWQKFVDQIKAVYGESVCQSLKLFIVDYYKQSGKEI